MAELTFKSAGVSTREIDLSQPTSNPPIGIPAGVIGTSQEGPAFVPLTFGNYSDFTSTFGASDGEKFGPMAVQQWLASAQSLTYLRVLGAGDGKKRNTSTGDVTNAGFTVGDKTVQGNGIIGDNPFATIYTGVAAKIVVTGFSTTIPTASDVLKIKPNGSSGTTQIISFLAGTTQDETTFGASVANTAKIYIGNHTGNMTSLLAAVAIVWNNFSGYNATSDTVSLTITSNTSIASSKNLANDSTSLTAITESFAVTAGVSPISNPKGRTYFLGTFMSESNGSTIFSDAGIQSAPKGVEAARLASALDTDTATTANNDTIVFTVPTAAGGQGTTTIKFTSVDATGDNADAANIIGIGISGSPSVATIQGAIIAAINGTSNGRVTLAPSANGQAGIQGVTATDAGSNAITITAGTSAGIEGNSITLAMATNSLLAGGAASVTLAGGVTASSAVPILRGVLLAPSGVILHLSGNYGSDITSVTPVKGQTATDGTSFQGRAGFITGSLNLSSQEFVMLLNGYTHSDASKKTYVTASLDTTSPNYFGNVFNKDPLKIEEEGHLLYGQYDIYPTLAHVTSKGVFTAGTTTPDKAGSEDIVFLLTGSGVRNTGDATSANYESFNDRFTHAETPWVISQNLGTPVNLFKLYALSAGEGVANKYKFSVENIRKSNSLIASYGTFDLVVRDFNDSDSNPVVLESFRGLSLDPSSEKYIGRVIGDQHIYFNFDIDSESQRIVVDGTHPVNSRFVRVSISDEVANSTISEAALPFGFRGPRHLNTSGSLLSHNGQGTGHLSADLLGRVVEPPVPFRETIAQGTGLQKRVDGSLYWGVQWSKKTSATLPNKASNQEVTMQTFTKHFPTHRLNEIKFSEGDNAGVADVNGTVRDSDRFNNNKFTLENIQVRTGSDGLADPEYWLSASYVRGGNIVTSDVAKTRRFGVDDLGKVSNIKFAKFTFFAQGGFDGNNVFNTDKSKLTNTAVHREMLNEGGTANNTVTAYRKAVEIMSSKSDVDIQLLAIPGLRHSSITDYAINKIEDRFDAMYIMDIEEKDRFDTVITSSAQKPHVDYTVSSFKNRGLDSSFAAAYFPDVVIQDGETRSLVQVPPSVAVLGAYALNDKLAHPWFAPAGFSRGALDTVEISSVKLNRSNLDNLYEADINPIAEFPGIGITIWGQKTLQAANSALDRVNVRRLLIDVRRKVRNIANTLLFEPNREETLERFSSLVNPILQRVQEQSGIERYKAVIDTSTTTQADVENNTIRGKIYLQPTRSVEFVALDFVVTNAGSNI